MTSSIMALARRITRVERELAASRVPQLDFASVQIDETTEVSVVEGIQTALAADTAASAAREAADQAALDAADAAAAGAIAQSSADAAAAAAASVRTDVDGIPAQIAAAKTEAITTAAGTAQSKADAAQAAAINAAALTAQAKADAAKAAALTEAAVTAQQKADAAAATAKAEALAAAATDAQTKADVAKAAAINAAATDAKSKADAAQANAIASAATTAQTKADAAKQAAIDAATLDAKAKADAAQSAATTAAAADAKSKADAAQAAAQAAAKTYSDTVASGAKTDAITAAAADAKSKADAAEAAAKAAAAADAKAKADAAQAAAIAAAATDAQTKADVAKAAAINAAATDAQTKANTARDAAIAAASLMSNKIQNPTRTGTTVGWIGGPLAVETKDFYGTPIRAMKATSSADTQFYSDYFDVDVNKGYEVRFWLLDPSNTPNPALQQFYLGLNAQRADGSLIPVVQTAAVALTQSDNSNFYWGYTNTPTAAGQWREYVAYLFPHGASTADMKNLGTNVLFHASFKPDTTKLRLRFLNWGNAGTSRDLWVAHTVIREMSLMDLRAAATVESWRVTGKTTINGGSIETDTVTALQIGADAVKARNIEASAVVAGKIATDAVAANNVQAGAIIAGKIATDAIAANNIQANAIVAGKIAADGVLATNIVTDAILARHIKVGQITADKLVAGTITAASGVIGSIDAAKITVNKITAAQMAVGTITAASGVIGDIDAAKITVGKISASQLAADAIDGKTITGALIRSAATGPRVELTGGGTGGKFSVFTASANETTPGGMSYYGGGGYNGVIISNSVFKVGANNSYAPRISMATNETTGDGDFQVQTSKTWVYTQDSVGGGLTGKTIGSKICLEANNNAGTDTARIALFGEGDSYVSGTYSPGISLYTPKDVTVNARQVGITAVSASGQGAQVSLIGEGVVDLRGVDLNYNGSALPLGWLGGDKRVTNSGSTSSTTEAGICSTMIQVKAGHKYRITGWSNLQSSVAGDGAGLRYKVNGSTVALAQVYLPIAGTSWPSTDTVIWTSNVTGSVLFETAVYRVRGTGTIFCYANASQASYIDVEHIGSA